MMKTVGRIFRPQDRLKRVECGEIEEVIERIRVLLVRVHDESIRVRVVRVADASLGKTEGVLNEVEGMLPKSWQ